MPNVPLRSEPSGRVAAERLGITRRGLILLDDCSFHVDPGEILSVMGPSGSGKTTLLRTLAGLVEADKGHVIRPEGRVTFVFQDPRLLPWRTALANVSVVLPKEQRNRASFWLERVGLGDALDVYPAKLSGGMRQRVAIARALACESSLLLVDEPFASLDAQTALRLREMLVTELRELNRPTIWVTHNAAEARAVSSRTLVMDGPPDGSWSIEDRTVDPGHHAPDRAANPTTPPPTEPK